MSISLPQKNPRWFLESLTHHVLQPLETAKSGLEQEKRELSVECEALESFRDATADIEIELPPHQQYSSLSENPSNGGTDSVRQAYERTFFSVDHQEAVYADSLVESMANEFGWDLAAAVRPGNRVQFSPQLKAMLVSATEKSVAERKALLQCIETEQDSVASAHAELSEILETLESSVIPEWYRCEFQSRIEAVVQDRQRTLNDRTRTFDNHDFCAYLYEDADWTYPVLTSVARFRESVAMS